MKSLENFQHQAILTAEKKCLASSFSQLKGYYLLIAGRHRCVGDLPKNSLYNAAFSPMPPIENTQAYIRTAYEHIPLRNNAIDGVVLPYLLEYCESPEELLKEIFRITVGEGKLYLFCFQRLHPWCWWNAPKAKRCLSAICVRNLLQKTGFSIVRFEHIYYGSVIFFEAQKQLYSLTPLRPEWKISEPDNIFIEPAARQNQG